MMFLVKKPLLCLVLATGLFTGSLWSAALANEGGLILPTQGNSDIELRLNGAGTGVDPARALKVFVGGRDDCCADRTPMAGQYRVKKGAIVFNPAFDLVEGQTYTVLSQDKNASGQLVREVTEFEIKTSAIATAAEVIAIYPSGDAIPENTLRFYIHFSTAMQPHRSTDFIELTDAAGNPDTEAFMTFKQELWSEDRRRLTLLMDPGRIKRGVAQNLTLGPALEAGNRYSIVVKEGWPTARGGQETPRFERKFSVSQALRTLPSTKLWDINAPRTSARDPLIIAFDRPFDHQLIQDSIQVQDMDGQPISGELSIQQHEHIWHFEPETPWNAQSVQIAVDARLEDVAGNNFRELLDHTLGSELQDIDLEKITLKLRPPPG